MDGKKQVDHGERVGEGLERLAPEPQPRLLLDTAVPQARPAVRSARCASVAAGRRSLPPREGGARPITAETTKTVIAPVPSSVYPVFSSEGWVRPNGTPDRAYASNLITAVPT